MDAFIAQYKWKKLIADSIGEKLKYYGYIYKKQGDNAYYYENNYTEIRIVYYHKEIGINFKNKNKSIHSSDIINNCQKMIVEQVEQEDFEGIEEYFKTLLLIEFSNVEKCMPNVFYGDFSYWLH